jgi:hypothetical protein
MKFELNTITGLPIVKIEHVQPCDWDIARYVVGKNNMIFHIVTDEDDRISTWNQILSVSYDGGTKIQISKHTMNWLGGEPYCLKSDTFNTFSEALKIPGFHISKCHKYKMRVYSDMSIEPNMLNGDQPMKIAERSELNYKLIGT